MLPVERASYVFGNPPFVGAKFMDDAQREDVQRVFADIKSGGLLDYVAAWYVKAARYINTVRAELVEAHSPSTSSGRTGGVPVRALPATHQLVADGKEKESEVRQRRIDILRLKMRMPELDQKENHYVKATLNSEDSEIRDVPCKIFLPERIYEKPYLLFKPKNSADTTRVMSFHAAKYKALIIGLDKKLQSTIEAQEVYFSQSGTTYWGDDLSESTTFGEPQHLHVIHHRDSTELQVKTQMVFWISPNQLLAPSAVRTTARPPSPATHNG